LEQAEQRKTKRDGVNNCLSVCCLISRRFENKRERIFQGGERPFWCGAQGSRACETLRRGALFVLYFWARKNTKAPHRAGVGLNEEKL
jgi:hypothetical protein